MSPGDPAQQLPVKRNITVAYLSLFLSTLTRRIHLFKTAAFKTKELILFLDNFCLIMKRYSEVNFTSFEEFDICARCVHGYYVSLQNKCVRTLNRCWIFQSWR